MSWKNRPAAALAGLLLLHLLAHIDRNMLMAFAPHLIAELQLSHAQYGFLVGAVWVLSFGGMAMLMGTLADRYSRPRVIACGVLIWSVCTWASGHAQNFEQMVLARFFVASGEAALVPAAAALLTELFAERRRGTALGIFFMGIPLGIGCSFLLAGAYHAGWRTAFTALGAAGVALGLPLLLLRDERTPAPRQPRGAPLLRQAGDALRLVRATPALRHTIAGFVLVNMVFAGLSFTQLWLVNERGMDGAGIATRIGALQLIFGALGAVCGGSLGDRYARRWGGGHAGFAVLLLALCTPLMAAYRYAPAGSPLFYAGMCASFFLPLALYGPANGIILGLTPPHLRATVSGFTMLAINVFAIALGNMALGAASDYLARAGYRAPLTGVLLATDVLAACALPFFALAARRTAAPVASAQLPALENAK